MEFIYCSIFFKINIIKQTKLKTTHFNTIYLYEIKIIPNKKAIKISIIDYTCASFIY